MAALPTVIQTQARKQGYLSKTGGKSLSGWKKRWFVLDDESLRYFTDNSLTKIKGTIPLKDYEECECAPEEKKPTFKLYSSNKEIRAFNIQAETEADAKAWAQSITTCIKRMRDIVAKYGPGAFRTERSLFVKIAEVKNLAEEKDTYCAIVEYDMELEAAGHELVVQLKPNNKKKDADIIGASSIKFAELAGGAVVEKWFPLYANLNDPSKATVGELRLAIQYSSVTVLADDSYDNLFRLLLKDKMAATILLSQASAKKEKVVADCLVKAFEARKTGAHYIKTIIQSEIESTGNPNIIFRGNTVATKSVDTYMRLVGLPYLSTVLGPIIQEIFQGKKSCELDTQRINGGSKEKTAEKNLQNLLAYCKRIFEAIASSFNRCPASFRNIFEYMQEIVIKRFPDDEFIRYTAPGGFIFLRFFCPALLGPKLFNLANDHPPENVARDLTLIAKTIQNLANLVPFGQKEPYMEGVNQFIAEYTPQMKKFLDTLCSPPTEAIDEISSKISLNFGREMARIHAHMSSSLPTMIENVKTKGDQTDSVAVLDEIRTVLDRLNEELANPGMPGRTSTPQPGLSTAPGGSSPVIRAASGIAPGGIGGSSSSPAVGGSSTPNLRGTGTPPISSGTPGLASTSSQGGSPGLVTQGSASSISSAASSSSFATAASAAPTTGTATPDINATPSSESASAQAEVMLLRRKLQHMQFIQEQQEKLLELERTLSAQVQ